MSARPLAAACTAWGLLMACGLAWFENYAAEPGRTFAISEDWPRESSLKLSPDRPTLVMFLHPGCACSRAGVGELERLVAKHRSQLTIQFVMASPPGDADTQSDLYEDGAALRRLVSRIPESSCVDDVCGREAVHFHACTSGEAFIFEPEGALRFHGGLTARRGHEGHSAGQEALERILAGTESRLVTTRVFGCPLGNSPGSGNPTSEKTEP